MTALLDRVYDIIISTRPTYNNRDVLVQKGQLLTMSPEQLKNYSNELMCGLLSQGSGRPGNAFSHSLITNTRYFEIAVRGLKKQSEQHLELWLMRFVRQFIDCLDDVIVDIQVTDDIDRVGYDQNGNLEISLTLIVNTINLTDGNQVDILTTSEEVQVAKPKIIGGLKHGKTNRSPQQGIQRAKISGHRPKPHTSQGNK